MSKQGRDYKDLLGMLIQTSASHVLLLMAAILPVGLLNIRTNGGFDITLDWLRNIQAEPEVKGPLTQCY